MADTEVWSLGGPIAAPAATDRVPIATGPNAGGYTERGDFLWRNGNTFEGFRATDGDVLDIGKSGGQRLRVFVSGDTIGLFNVAGAGAGRDGMRIGANYVAFDVDAAEALQFDVDGHWLPGFDNSRNIGSGAKRIKDIFLVNSPTITSDESEKTWRSAPTAAELAAARRIIAELGFFQWNDAIADKGAEGARYHFGVRAQAVWAIMADEGLIDPIVEGVTPSSSYAFLCYDEFPAVEAAAEERDDEGNITVAAVEARPAGNRFGIRPDQLTLFLIAAQEARIAALEAAA